MGKHRDHRRKAACRFTVPWSVESCALRCKFDAMLICSCTVYDILHHWKRLCVFSISSSHTSHNSAAGITGSAARFAFLNRSLTRTTPPASFNEITWRVTVTPNLRVDFMEVTVDLYALPLLMRDAVSWVYFLLRCWCGGTRSALTPCGKRPLAEASEAESVNNGIGALLEKETSVDEESKRGEMVEE